MVMKGKNPAREHFFRQLFDKVSEVLKIKTEDIWAKGKYQRIVDTRSLLCYWAVRELGMPMSNLSIKLGISIPSVSVSVRRGQRIAEKNEFTLLAS